jgi:hypothetical protein
MTIWVGQGQSHLPADVLGITATSGQGGRLRPRSWLRQQPAEIFTTGGPSRRRRRKPPTDALLKVAGTRQDRQRPETGVTPAMHGLHQPQRASPSSTKGSEADQGHIPRICRSKGKRRFTKRPAPRQRARGGRGPHPDRGHGGARSRAAGRLNCNHAPAYIRGPRPLE